MPGNLLTTGSQVLCGHLSGQGRAAAPAQRVSLGREPAVLAFVPWVVERCGANPPYNCVTATWTTAATRVTSMSQPLAISTGAATCVPSGLPLTPVVSQVRVTAT